MASSRIVVADKSHLHLSDGAPMSSIDLLQFESADSTIDGGVVRVRVRGRNRLLGAHCRSGVHSGESANSSIGGWHSDANPLLGRRAHRHPRHQWYGRGMVDADLSDRGSMAASQRMEADEGRKPPLAMYDDGGIRAR